MIFLLFDCFNNIYYTLYYNLPMKNKKKWTAEWAGAVEYTQTVSLQRGKTTPNQCPGYDTKLYLLVRLQ